MNIIVRSHMCHLEPIQSAMNFSILEFVFRFLNLVFPLFSEQFIGFLVRADKTFNEAELVSSIVSGVRQS